MKLDIKTLLLEFFISILGVGEFVNLLSIVKNFSLSTASKYFTIMQIVVVVAFLCLLTASVIALKKKKITESSKSTKGPVTVPLIIFFIVVVFQIVFYFLLCKPYILSDITGETVNTFIKSNSFHVINPLTGYEYSEGIPLRLQILCLPFVYACISNITHISSYILVYKIVPIIVLLITYWLYYLYADFLFGIDTKKKGYFMLVASIVMGLGYIGTITETRFLLLQPWTGDAIRTLIILPFLILSLLKKRWFDVVICLLAEAILCWTLYGLGYGIIIVFAFILVKLIIFICNRRAKNE